MSDFRQEPSLDAIRLSDDFIEALAGGHTTTPQGSADAELAALLGGWRDEMRWPPATGLLSEPQAIAALDAGLSEKRKRDPLTAAETPLTAKRRQRGLSMVGAAAAAVLCVGGFGAVVSSAGPGDALYGLRTMMFGTPKQVREDQVALAARTELQQVQELIAQGDWQQAQEKLVAVSSQVESLDDVGQKQELVEQFNDLSAKVVERDPAATAPPGITYTVSESSTQLVPTVAPTSVPSAPSSTESTSGDSATESSETTPSEPSSSSETPASEDAPASETAPVSGTATSVTTSQTAASGQTASGQTSSGPTTTPTSAAPTTTTIAPKISSVVPTTTVVPSPASAPQTTVAPSTVQTPAAQTPAQQASSPQATASQTAAQTASEGPQTLPPSITTTVVAPVPVG